MKRSRWILIAAVVVVAVIGIWWWKARSAGSEPKYRTAEVDRGNIESVVSATGTIRPVIQVEIGSQVSGTVDKLNADYNSKVRAGQILVELEKSSFVAREVQAEAAVTRADASVKDAVRALKRSQELFDQHYVSQADLDAASVAVDLRKADLQQAQAALVSAQVDLAHATIRSPIDGVVISRSIDRGQTVAASLQAPQLFVIANDLSQMQVESKIDEADIGRLKQGLPVSFTVDAFPDRTFEGHVEQVRLEPITESGVVTYTTVIQTANPNLELRPGMTANVTVRIEHRDDVVRIPNAALRFHPAGGNAGGGAGQGGPAGGRTAAAESGRSGGSVAGAATRGDGAMRGGRSGRGPRADSTGMQGSGGGGGWRGHKGGQDAAPDSLSNATPAAVYVMRGGKLEKLIVFTGITDGSFTEVRGGALRPGDTLVVGSDGGSGSRANSNLQPPPGMGGFRGPGGGGGRR